MEIIFEDNFLVVCIKPAGVLSQSGSGKPGMPEILGAQLNSEIYPVHRLDREVGGLMVYAKTAKSAANLSQQVADRTMQKEYLAAVWGEVQPESGEMCDLLFKDSKKNKSFVVRRMRKGVREAKLSYETVARGEIDGKPVTAVRVRLHTGRSHQIRVQFASRKHPLLGDRKYGADAAEKEIALFSSALTFRHPATGEVLKFKAMPPQESLFFRVAGERIG